MVGGGPRLRPGLVTQAHQGALFLDELAEFDRDVLDALSNRRVLARLGLERNACSHRIQVDIGACSKQSFNIQYSNTLISSFPERALATIRSVCHSG